MAMDEDIGAFLSEDDFAVIAIAGSKSAKVLLDMPDTLIGGGEVITTDYKITYKTNDLTLSYDTAIKVDGVNYTVKDARKIDDGQLSEAFLSKV